MFLHTIILIYFTGHAYQLNYSVMDILTVLMIQMKDGVILNMILMLLLPVITGKILKTEESVISKIYLY